MEIAEIEYGRTKIIYLFYGWFRLYLGGDVFDLSGVMVGLWKSDYVIYYVR